MCEFEFICHSIFSAIAKTCQQHIQTMAILRDWPNTTNNYRNNNANLKHPATNKTLPLVGKYPHVFYILLKVFDTKMLCLMVHTAPRNSSIHIYHLNIHKP